jgi:hypothetical protein
MCHRQPAAGFAVLGGKRYCIGELGPTCFELAQEIEITDDGRAHRLFTLVAEAPELAEPLLFPHLDSLGTST